MAPGSPRVTRRQKKTHHDSSADELDDSHDHSCVSIHNRSNDSSYQSSFQKSRNDSSLFDADKTAFGSHNDSEKSYGSSSPSGLYPNLKELNASGDSPYTRKEKTSSNSPPNRKGKAGYPNLESLSESKEKEAGYNAFHFALMIFVVLIVFVCLGFFMGSSFWTDSSSSSSSTKSANEVFEDKIKVLNSSFPSQTHRFWATISASVRHVFEQRDPCYPSVILMTSQNKNKRLNTCLAKKIASIFSSSHGLDSQSSRLHIDVEDIKHLESGQQKLTLDEAMQTAFQQNKEKAFVISNIHSLSPTAALLLHGFCDGDNAPYKDVMIVLTFQVDDSIIFHSVKEVEGFLTDFWSQGLHMDKLSALMSRIANNPVVLKAEGENIVNKFCT